MSLNIDFSDLRSLGPLNEGLEELVCQFAGIYLLMPGNGVGALGQSDMRRRAAGCSVCAVHEEVLPSA